MKKGKGKTGPFTAYATWARKWEKKIETRNVCRSQKRMQEPETNAEAPASSECISQVADNKQIMMTVKKGESHLIQIQSEMVLLKKKKNNQNWHNMLQIWEVSISKCYYWRLAEDTVNTDDRVSGHAQIAVSVTNVVVSNLLYLLIISLDFVLVFYHISPVLR